MKNGIPGDDSGTQGNGKPVVELSTREGYDRWADLYDGEDNCLILLEEERFSEYLGDPTGLRIADIGSGTGRHAVPLARAGAQVTALDFSDGMIGKARDKSGWEDVRFLKADLAAPFPLKACRFDRVICCLVLDHIGDLPSFFGQLGRICKPEGRIVVSAMHPALLLRGIQARFTDPATGRKVLPQSFPNQVSDYVMGAVKAGLKIDAMGEYLVEPRHTALSEKAERYVGWLMLLMMRLRP